MWHWLQMCLIARPGFRLCDFNVTATPKAAAVAAVVTQAVQREVAIVEAAVAAAPVTIRVGHECNFT